MDSKLTEYYEREETLRQIMQAQHEAYVQASEAYDWHRRRLTTMGCGPSTKRFLDGQKVG